MFCKYKDCKNAVRYKKLQLCHKHYMMEYKGKTEETAGFEIKNCEICNKEFKPNCPTAKYCSDECKIIGRNNINRIRRKKPIIDKICICCGENFKTTRSFQRACDKCRKVNELNTKNNYYRNVLKPKFGYLDKGNSYPQKFIFETLTESFPKLNWKYDDRSILRNPDTNYAMELDILCLEKSIAIEYDGEHHFSSKIYGEENYKYIKYLDAVKNKLCKEKNIKLIRINHLDNWKDKEWIIWKVGELINVNN